MKFALISDIHGNIEALEAVVNDARARGLERFLCLGDVVGYGPSPAECVDLVQSLHCPVIRGNHDQFAATDIKLDGCNEDARASLEWTREQLSDDQRKWLGQLPLTAMMGNFVIAHANLIDPGYFGYVRDEDDADLCLTKQSVPVCFIGHTHVPAIFIHGEGVTPTEVTNSYAIQPGTKTLVNVGSVGQPRDGDPRAAYVVYDAGAQIFTFQRITYNIEKTQERLREIGLPEDLADRLSDAA
jgi:diadenosine tetraphosphatase ApaH/serine/threonine PP2A family protein phosphatase